MKTLDLIGTAFANTLRAKTRSILTILAIFIGAFTLTLTSGLGTGINAYISDTVTGIGATGTMTVTKTSETQSRFDAAASGPVKYDPDAISTGQVGPDRVATVTALTPADLTSLAGIDGVTDVHATILHQLGLDPHMLEIPGRKRLERDFGHVIPEILA